MIFVFDCVTVQNENTFSIKFTGTHLNAWVETGTESSILPKNTTQCVVPENIHTPTTEGIGNSEEEGGSKTQENPEGRGVVWSI